MADDSFSIEMSGLQQALAAIGGTEVRGEMGDLPATFPEEGVGELSALEQLAPIVLGGACKLGSATAFAHMDPPTPWISWATTQWNAAVNQNLLHPDVAPMARDLEERVIDWLAPPFAMEGGHLTPGSTISNLTALWAAREIKGITRIVAAETAHLSVGKAAHILGLEYLPVQNDRFGRLDVENLPDTLTDTALVVTAGSTAAGAIDPLGHDYGAAWLHIDAAWAGPLIFSERYRDRLAGMEDANSVAVSGHKWLFQPKECGVLLFKDAVVANQAVSFGADYLAVPNVGVLGSHGANAIPLLATLLSWGRAGLAERLERAMAKADQLHDFLSHQPEVEVFGANESGVILWRSRHGIPPPAVLAELPQGAASTARIGGFDWLRHVAANPNVDISRLTEAIDKAIRRTH